ncbi:heme lyase CcmF/NrfE family subunit [Notoacmeibacter ruber]|uniref:Heme lyase CcmF/NrfE family subunit n=1 Tax=Notoacmeibacter ruber TaxID=2670375 RepID=A0A3L7JGV7_9HYPH|nr:heme lyase CcmF/NrfE family subunit [Notoacmeibacter ruber]RLQ89389.1 heme lyase CcmF/NrfE family subunit [Notoacmeibacter ruber]
MIETGHFALVLALALSLFLAIVPLAGALRHDERVMATATPTALCNFLLVALSFAVLGASYYRSDFSVLNVFENSHSQQPAIYRVTATWGNHEGSMMLWIFILALFTALVAAFGKSLPLRLKTLVLAIQGWVSAAFLLFILLTSNPFARLSPAPLEGQDLNPILQDIGLAIHPPLLYLGYVGFSVAFSFAIASLIDGRMEAAWARWVRPWTLLAWTFLTAGIAVGSYWAYYELGWGGWWFWDPVENASFMPWLSGTALLHSAIVMEKRDALKVWTLLLAIITFSLSLLGTFLVRSGILTSVHSFASDPTRGLFILGILTFFIGGALLLFALRASSLKVGGLFAPISREGSLVLNNLFLATATATVLVGTLYPLLVEAFSGEKISVGAPFFNLTFGPLMVPLLIAVPFGPLLSWKRADLAGVSLRLAWAFGFAVLAVAVCLIFVDPTAVFAALGAGLAAWLLAGAVTDLAVKAGLGRVAPSVAGRRLVGLPRSMFGTALGHAGLGVTVLGIVCVTAFQQERILTMQPGDQVEIADYRVTFDTIVPERGPNFVADRARFAVETLEGVSIGEISSSKRIYTARRMPTTEAGIRTFVFSQLYLSLGDLGENGGAVVRIWYKPLVTLIWLGALLMTIGGFVSLSDRRLRVGAPRAPKSRNRHTAEAVG